MPARYFRNRLPEYVAGIEAPWLRALAEEHVTAFLNTLAAQPVPSEPSLYTGAAGISYSLWRAARAAHLPTTFNQAELLGVAARLARSALATVHRQSARRYGWSLLAGHAGVYCTSALVLRTYALVAKRLGQRSLAAGLFQEERQCVQEFVGLHSLACHCEEDEVLYGRSGYLLGCLMLNRAQPDSVPSEVIQRVVQAIIDSGACTAAQPACLPQLLLCMAGTAARYVSSAAGSSQAGTWHACTTAQRFPPLCCTCGLRGLTLCLILALHMACWVSIVPPVVAGRRCAAVLPGWPTPLMFVWHGKPYLGCAHGLQGGSAMRQASPSL
jgi:hypothetical protein